MVLSLARSFVFAFRIMDAMKGAVSREKPVGSPLFRKVMRVLAAPAAAHE
jgi:hypothetical protein